MGLLAKPKVVIVEDDAPLARVVKQQLELIGMSAVVFSQGGGVVEFFQQPKVGAHLLLLDLNLPDSNGLLLFKRLQEQRIAVPTIFVTGETDERTKVQSLDMGGDDYLTKPFSLAELLSRVNAVLRRTTSASEDAPSGVSFLEDEFFFCSVRVIPGEMELQFPDGPMCVGKRIFGLIAYLSHNSNVVLPRSQLIRGVWGRFANPRGRSLDQYIMHVRRLFQQQGCSTDQLRTVHGVGYYYQSEGTQALPPRPNEDLEHRSEGTQL
ncbi:MAG: response regulator transcription factor [Puniceicoccales bacterium]|jgi:two-component system alkaline phosphatase synthesis response regulator PhoP|nr:response regulator transcription factor [Puniceicoccales bacterium]